MVAFGATDGTIPFLVQRIMDDVFARKDETALNYLPLLVIGLFAFRGLMNFGQSYLNDYVGLRIINDVRNQLNRHFQSLSLSFFHRNATGMLLARVNSDVQLVRFAITDALAWVSGLARKITERERTIAYQVLKEIAAGKHLTTLAFSESGSRSQFWAPVSKLTPAGGHHVTSAHKSWVTSAHNADSYVASGQRPGAESPLESTLYLVRRGAKGVRVGGEFDGLGLRGNDSAPVTFEDVTVSAADLLTPQGGGAKEMLEVVLPWFSIGSAAMANGLGRAAVSATARHVTGTQFEHTGTRLRDLPNVRARVADMALRTEQARALLGRTLDELESGSAETPLFVLMARLGSLEAALAVTDLAMKTCGGVAFSRQLPVERLFRDARAGWVMAPTADHLTDFIGRALTGLPLF